MSLADRVVSRPISRKHFAKLMASALRDAGVEITSVNDEDFSLGELESGTIYLENVYGQHSKASRKERQAIIDNFVRSIAERESLPTLFEDVAERLMPVIRSSAYHSAIRLMLKANGERHEPLKLKSFVGGIVANLALDTDRNILHIAKSDFDKWNVDFDVALAKATANLLERTDPESFVEVRPGLYKCDCRDGYDSSRMLLADVLLRLGVFGDPVAFIPGRDHLWVAGSEDETAIAKMLELGGESLFEPYSLSANLFLLNGKQWTVYTAPDGPIASALRNLQQRRDQLDYEQQKSDLEKLYEREKFDVFVASFTRWEAADGEVYTSCVWSKDIPSLLPKTERIFFYIDGDQKDRFTVAWDEVQSRFPELLPQEPYIFPNRFQAYRYPSSDQLDVLRLLAIG